MVYRSLPRAVRTALNLNTARNSRGWLARTTRVCSAGHGRSYTYLTTSQRQHDELNERTTVMSVRTDKTWQDKKPALVIFDKDGTLICFHSMWYPWLKDFSKKMCAATGLDLEEKLYKLLGYSTKSNKFNPGLMAEDTKPVIQKELLKMLQEEGLSHDSAYKIIHDNWEEGHTMHTESLEAIADTRTLFKILKSQGIKIAVSTSDSRAGTLLTLKELEVEEYVDLVVCGDDPDIVPKPDPYSAFKICKQLGVEPSETVMVGDTFADVGMGKAANIGWNVGVLSGVGNSGDLLPEADHVIHSVTDLLPLILPGKEWCQYYQYSPAERIIVEPHDLDGDQSISAGSQTTVKDGIRLVIFDLHGTLLCTNDRFVEWLDTVCRRIDETTGLQLTNEIHDSLGVCFEKKTLKQGIVSEGTWRQVKSRLCEILLSHNLPYQESMLVVNQTWEECAYLMKSEIKLSDPDVEKLFQKVKQNLLKIAINTGDSRETVLSDLDSFGLLKYVDMIVCGDDPHSQAKPSPHNVLLVCNEFDISTRNTLLIGDTMADIQMASNAKIFKKIGVLNGEGNNDDLRKHADAVVPKVGEIDSYLFETSTESTSPKPSVSQKAQNRPTSTRFFSTIAGNLKSSYSRMFSIPRRSFSTTGVRAAGKSTSHDYIVVGAGSAGCVMANRLTEDGKDKVLVMEAGPSDFSWKIWMPAALMYNLCDDNYNWSYHTEPEKAVNNRVMYWPRGRVLGGSSCLNAMVYIRGNALDYDRWEQEGATNWSYASCLPYFKKSQHHELGEDDYRGGSGPLRVSRGVTNNPLHHAFIEAGQQAGYPFTDDMNGYQQEGVGWMDMTIHKGWRWSAAEAYIHPVKERQNLEIKVKALTTKIIFDKNKAIGIEYIEKGQTKRAMANKEVILSGGAINSPQLLMLSGVGNADDLRELDIPVVANLPGVGENLQEHLEICIQQKCTQPITLYSAQWKFPHNMVGIGAKWFLTQKGWGATTHLETGGFIRSRPGVEHPDLQIHFLPSVVNDHGRKNGDCHAYQVHIGPMRPTSKGYLKLKSRNPTDHPSIVANYLKTEGDMQEFRDAIKLTRELFQQKAFDEFRGGALNPSDDVQSQSQMDEFIRAKADSAYHPSCTCKMGQSDDPMAVVDPEARVIGLENLRVIDASIMPSVVSGNLNGPTIMLAEKAADIVRGITPLPQSTAAVYRPKTIETQR